MRQNVVGITSTAARPQAGHVIVAVSAPSVSSSAGSLCCPSLLRVDRHQQEHKILRAHHTRCVAHAGKVLGEQDPARRERNHLTAGHPLPVRERPAAQ